jgi:hypothetical protein
MKAYREGIATRREAIHDKIDDKLRANWVKLDTDHKKRKADMLKAYEKKRMAKRKADEEGRKAERKALEEKRMAKQKADQERREAERIAYEMMMMIEQKADQEKREAERKAYEMMMVERKDDQKKGG